MERITAQDVGKPEVVLVAWIGWLSCAACVVALMVYEPTPKHEDSGTLSGIGFIGLGAIAWYIWTNSVGLKRIRDHDELFEKLEAAKRSNAVLKDELRFVAFLIDHYENKTKEWRAAKIPLWRKALRAGNDRSRMQSPWRREWTEAEFMLIELRRIKPTEAPNATP